ncbi:MAG: ribonuclease P protein component [Candidatus Staskawiczbacteria bacterium]|nr:ribonuclease P protein component [Candidatus Staskawiczbacteria bacterium]
MLPKINRIKKKKDFEFIFRNGVSFKNSCLILKVVKNNLDYSRFGFVVSGKVSKKAVDRNKIRRRLSEIVKKEVIKAGLDLVFISLSSAKGKSFSELKKETQTILIKAKALNV